MRLYINNGDVNRKDNTFLKYEAACADGFVQYCSKPNAPAMDLLQSCA